MDMLSPHRCESLTAIAWGIMSASSILGSAPRRPHALVCGVIVAAIALAAPARAAARKSSSPPTCQHETVAAGTVKAIIDGRSFMLADGREIRLAGIEVPPLPAMPGPVKAAAIPAADGAPDPGVAAANALAALVANREVILQAQKLVTDRYGRLLADATVTGADAGSVVKSLLSQGLARIAAHVGEPACTAELRAAERIARAQKLGLWGDPRYFPKGADDPAGVLAERGRFTLVEGKVVSVRESGGTIYMNFGQRWSEDFTVTILKRNERQFTAAGLALRSLAGRRVLVRGFIEERGGPWIDAREPEQIEILADR
jgi:endonuclease YncB( thermonuclease family)